MGSLRAIAAEHSMHSTAPFARQTPHADRCVCERVRLRTPTSRCAAPASRARRRRAASCRPASRPGDQTQIEAWPGATARMPPPTPLFAGQPDAVGEVARGVVEPAGQHQRVDPPRPRRPHHRVAGGGIAAAGGEEQPGPRQLAAAHRHRAMVEVDAEHLVDRMDQPVVGPHELGERVVARAGRLLGARHRRVDRRSSRRRRGSAGSAGSRRSPRAACGRRARGR